MQLQKNTSSLAGGICKWYYTTIDNLASFPAIDPISQMLTGQPTLKNGAMWFGPINIPTHKVGWRQTLDKTKPGTSYKHLVEGFIAGLDSNTQINLDNHAHYEICIVAKLRSGGHYIVLGNMETGCRLDDDTNTGTGPVETPGTKMQFNWESIDKAPTLPAFVP